MGEEQMVWHQKSEVVENSLEKLMRATYSDKKQNKTKQKTKNCKNKRRWYPYADM